MEKRSIYAILIYQLFTVVFGKHVPVIGWANFGSLSNTPTIPAGHFVNSETLQKDYLHRIVSADPHNICIFVINKLSIDDITKYSDAYNEDSTGSALANLRSSLETAKSTLVLPSADSSQVGSYLSSKVNGQVIELSKPSIKDQSLDMSKTNVIIFQLSPADSNNREAEIRNADNMMAALKQELESMPVPYTALLTSQQSPIEKKQNTLNFQESINVGRQILETDKEEEDEGFVFANFTDPPCEAYFYSKSMIVKVGGSNVKLPMGEWNTSGSNCTDQKEVNLVMLGQYNVSDNSEISGSKFEINIKLDGLDFWNAVSTKVTIIYTNGSDITQKIDMKFVETPKQFSYHCVESEAKALVEKGETARISKVTFNHLQLQPFEIKDHQFSDPNDCIGFFTEGIWMGLVTSLIILIILAFGFGMLANLSVMDKFDDPKGKTITVPQTED